MSTEPQTTQPSSAPNQREWDIVIFGATGDSGEAMATYIANNVDHYKKPNGGSTGDDRFRWAIAGRSEHKLNRLKSRLIVGRLRPSSNDEIGVLFADLASAEELNDLAKSTRVLISAVGPYTVLGESVYAACVENGTNYVDITAEVDWVTKMRKKYRDRATETGATLCSFAGYDSVPGDISIYAARKALSEYDKDENISLSSAETVFVLGGKSPLPRGTLRTMITKMGDFMAFSSSLGRFAPSKDAQWRTRLALMRWLLPRWSPEYGAFTYPHFMGWCNIPVLYNSCSSLDCIYHDRLAIPFSQDSPANGYGILPASIFCFFQVITAPLFLCFQVLVTFIPGAADLLLKIVDGLQYRANTKENQQQMRSATVDTWTFVTSSSGSKAEVHLHVNGDAGLICTALLAIETAFSMLMLLDEDKLPRGVIGSPSMIVADALVARLQDEETIGDECTLSVTVSDNDNKKKKE